MSWSTKQPTFPKPGDRFLRYRLDGLLGRGGASQVYLARDEVLGGRRFALKVSLDKGDEPAIQGRLDHPHIVSVNLVEREPDTGLRGLCMPYMPGLPLNEVIRRIDPSRNAPLDSTVLLDVLTSTSPGEEAVDTGRAARPGWADFPREGSYCDGVAWVVLKLAEALVHAHSRMVLHRDLKPANVLLTQRGGPMLLDFNLSQGQPDAQDAENALQGGTLPYMPPEQLAAFLNPSAWRQLGPQTDLYALGLVFHELLTGQSPPVPSAEMTITRRINDLLDLRLYAVPLSARPFNRRVPHALDAILARCTAPQMADRYPTAEHLAEDLRRFLDRRPLLNVTNPSRLEVARNSLHRNRSKLMWVAGAAILGLSTLAARLAADPKDSKDYVNKSMVLALEGDSKVARDALAHAFEKQTNLPEAQLLSAALLIKEEKITEALDLLDDTLARNDFQDLHTLQRSKGYINRALARIFRGEQILKQTSKASPELDSTRHQVALALDLFRGALIDLDVASSTGLPTTESGSTYAYKQIRAMLGQADALILTARRDEAETVLRNAKELTIQTISDTPNIQSNQNILRDSRRLLDAIETRLRSMNSAVARQVEI
jgi:serine/threonine protein kinase